MKDMDMSGSWSGSGSHIPWLTYPLKLHSSRVETCELTPEQCAYRTLGWINAYRKLFARYQADHVYALNTVYFCCAVIGVFALSNLIVKFAPEWVKRTRFWRTITSFSRYVTYRGYSFSVLRYWSPSLGVLILGILGAIYFFGESIVQGILGTGSENLLEAAMTLGPKPYYWPTDASYGGSPPIATRAGWMALALLPFVLALSAKANMISALTGVFHHWTSYAMFALALIHTFPFIIYNINHGDMVKEWKTSLVYWTGIGTIIPQAYLTIMSLPFIRDYFIATGAIYLLCLFTAQVRTFLMHGINTAKIEMLPSGLLRVAVPTTITWTPGQHVFIRFLTSDLHLLTAHPFTISSVYQDPDQTGKFSELIFYIKPCGGVTARLAAIATKMPGCSKNILIEGPYGGVGANCMTKFDTLIVIAGGSGGGFSLAMVDEALRISSLEKDNTKPAHGGRRHLQVVFSTRDHAMAGWYVEEIESRLSHSTTLSSDGNGFETSVSVHVTSTLEPLGLGKDGEIGKVPPTEITTTGLFSLDVHRNVRPDIPGIVERTVAMVRAETASGEKKKRIGVFVCGPASMLHDTRNAAAIAQTRTLNGEIEELYLHSEPFA
ncbi:Riboflavin synthase-like beta-barrel [Penicillium taxi]|uniref:Riboflavin synthase-like beta-barrel n=1 Tax=Penicillium taxi TaxID=168475 RepID=UPI0025457660|nr:Riboflavin synthase-like beta-barrel [Penicillium taxi]KAJ5895292.1 Riboflavin synthase-like beta-barrel [Penicillium taxi]